MAQLTATAIVPTGITPTLAAASVSGDEVPVGNKNFLVVTNGSGSAVTVTIVTTATVSGLAVADAGGSVPAGQTRWYGPFPASTFNDGTGYADVTYSAVTSVTVGVFTI